jgi:hypothetical protein
MGFFRCIVLARTHEFAAKKYQGKNRAMQGHVRLDYQGMWDSFTALLAY